MPRVLFKSNNQAAFLQKIKQKSGWNTEKLALFCGVSSRSFRDWLRGKLTISEQALLSLIQEFAVPLPENIEVVDDYWYTYKGAQMGAQRRFELYGAVATPEGRKKGGEISQLRRRENPEKYKLLGCNIRKEFSINATTLVDFAETVGIILGDGALTKGYMRISLSSLVDRPYAEYITALFQKVFNETPKWRERKECNTIELTICGVGLGDELQNYGLQRGNKVKNQVDFPEWIWKHIEYQKACVRGLMDTDGGCYFHTHKTNGLYYKNFGMCFTNKSIPIVNSVAKVLKSLNIKFSVVKWRIYIYSFEEIKKYFSIIGSHNAKTNEKFLYYLYQKSHRITHSHKYLSGRVLGVVDQAGLESLCIRKGTAGSNPAPSAINLRLTN